MTLRKRFNSFTPHMYVEFKMDIEYLHPSLNRLLLDEPYWKIVCIKRKYGKHPAVYLDVWMPRRPRLYELLPKTKFKKYDWNYVGQKPKV